MIAEIFSPLEEVLGKKVTAIGSDGYVSTASALMASGLDVEIGMDKPIARAPSSGLSDLVTTARPTLGLS